MIASKEQFAQSGSLLHHNVATQLPEYVPSVWQVPDIFVEVRRRFCTPTGQLCYELPVLWSSRLTASNAGKNAAPERSGRLSDYSPCWRAEWSM
jgi:hypothetical protein